MERQERDCEGAGRMIKEERNGRRREEEMLRRESGVRE
jgi:hypothetical protein